MAWAKRGGGLVPGCFFVLHFPTLPGSSIALKTDKPPIVRKAGVQILMDGFGILESQWSVVVQEY